MFTGCTDEHETSKQKRGGTCVDPSKAEHWNSALTQSERRLPCDGLERLSSSECVAKNIFK